MGYPYDKTYLEQIQNNKSECENIRKAYYVLRDKYIKEHPDYDDICLPISNCFQILGEAFELASYNLDNINDPYHFIWDVLDELLTYKGEEDDED